MCHFSNFPTADSRSSSTCDSLARPSFGCPLSRPWSFSCSSSCASPSRWAPALTGTALASSTGPIPVPLARTMPRCRAPRRSRSLKGPPVAFWECGLALSRPPLPTSELSSSVWPSARPRIPARTSPAPSTRLWVASSSSTLPASWSWAWPSRTTTSFSSRRSTRK